MTKINRLKTLIETATDHEIAAWLATTETPLIDGTTATYIYHNPEQAEHIQLLDDVTNWQPTNLEQIGSSNIWQHQHELPNDARIDYLFLIDNNEKRDPYNPHQAPSGVGPRSELRMPEYQASPYLAERAGLAKGEIEELGNIDSSINGTTHPVSIYLPAGYSEAQKYPTIYFQDGSDYLAYGMLKNVLDNAIAEGALPALIGIFVSPSLEHGRRIDYDLNPTYARFFATELIDMIDSKYATCDEAAERIVVGDSFGGLISLMIGLRYPEVFGGIVSQSGFVSRKGDQLMHTYAQAIDPEQRIDLLIGSYETSIGGLDRPDNDFLAGNRRMKALLEQQSATLRYREVAQGHAWGLWRGEIVAELAWALNWQAPT